MGSIRSRPETGALFMDFKFQGQRLREQTTLADNPANRKRLQKALDKIETDIALGTFDYEKTFGKPLPQRDAKDAPNNAELSPTVLAAQQVAVQSPVFREFADQWFGETEITWRRSYKITQRGALDKYLLPSFGDKTLAMVTKADVLAFRAELSKLKGRGKNASMTARRINAIMKPLRQILNEAADRYNFNSPFRNIKPLRMKRSEVMPFTMPEVQLLITSARVDFQPYFKTRVFTGMRTGEVNGLKWKYVDFERRLIYVRESIVLGEEDELKTDGSMRDIQMSQIVYDALKDQFEVTGKMSGTCSATAQAIRSITKTSSTVFGLHCSGTSVWNTARRTRCGIPLQRCGWRLAGNPFTQGKIAVSFLELAHTQELAVIKRGLAIPAVGHQWTVLGCAVVHASCRWRLHLRFAGHPVVAKEHRLRVVIRRA
jgi:integrase